MRRKRSLHRQAIIIPCTTKRGGVHKSYVQRTYAALGGDNIDSGGEQITAA